MIDSGLDFAALAKENDSLLIMTDLTCAPPWNQEIKHNTMHFCPTPASLSSFLGVAIDFCKWTADSPQTCQSLLSTVT